MVDFPTSLVDFQRRFPDEASCAAWLFEVRWPTGLEPRAALKVLEEVLGAQANMNAAAFVIDSSSQRTSD